MDKREPGYYWVKQPGGGWEPALWDKWWFGFNFHTPTDNGLEDIGPRIEPPEEQEATHG